MKLEVKNITYKVNNNELVRHVKFVSESNRCTAILGANGAGKSLLLRLCHGLIQPSEGDIFWNGKNPTQIMHQITMVFQNPILLARSTYKNIEHTLSLQKVAKNQRKDLIMEALDMVGLVDKAQYNANYLSGGQRQRLAIARAYVQKTKVVLMDEPTSGIDMKSLEMIEALVSQMIADGIKVMITSHNLAQAKRLCDEVVFLDKGKALSHTSMDEFFLTEDNPIVQQFIKSQTL